MPSPATTFKSLKVFDYDYAYLDSGAPPSTNYTTWVICHGMGFNGAVFEKLLPLAHTHNLRIVSVNRRGYPPSSGFQEDELNAVGRGKKFEEAEPFFRAQGTEIATFLVKFATEQGIPLADSNTATGGIVLIGWSLAAIHLLALLAYANELPQDTRSTLQKYLHTILSHGNTTFHPDAIINIFTYMFSDASTTALGIPDQDRSDLSAWLETDDRKRFDLFFDWTTAHYIHKSITSENPDDLEFNNPSDIPHSLRELSYEQRAAYTNLEAFTFTGCDGKLLFCDTTAFVALTKRALFDKVRAETLPNVRVRYMSSGTSAGMLVWPLWMLRKYVENPKELYGSDAEKARDIKSIIQVEGNHFIFWEDPEKAIQHYSASINL